jgi:primosomal protein N' (replication factor Y)
MDDAAAGCREQMELARWIAQYYCAPLGEVLRGMLPLAAEVKRQFVYRIAEAGRRVLYEGAAKGSSRRSRLTPEEQNREYAVLNYLEDGEHGEGSGRCGRRRGRIGAAGGDGQEEVAGAGGGGGGAGCAADWSVAVLVEAAGGRGRGFGRQRRLCEYPRMRGMPGVRLPKLNENQLAVMAELAAVGGRMRWRSCGAAGEGGVPESTLATLVKRGLVAIEEERRRSFMLGGHAANGKKHAHEHALNEAQMEAWGRLRRRWRRVGFGRICCMGYRVGQDDGVFCGDAAGAGCGQERAAAGAGDWADAGDGGADVCGVRG